MKRVLATMKCISVSWTMLTLVVVSVAQLCSSQYQNFLLQYGVSENKITSVSVSCSKQLSPKFVGSLSDILLTDLMGNMHQIQFLYSYYLLVSLFFSYSVNLSMLVIVQYQV